MKPITTIIATAAALSTTASADTHGHGIARPDGHAPISIMGDHTHKTGEWMLSYRYMFMEMDGMFDGNNSVSPGQIFAQNFAVTPTRMTMEMHMLGLMYAPSDRVTFAFMLPYVEREMDHLIGLPPLIGFNGGSSTFTTRSSGIGDLRISSLITILDEGSHHFHAGFGVSLPTGSVGEQDTIPVPMLGRVTRQLPAAMQPGTGTVNILPSITYTYLAEKWSAGAQASGVYHIDENAHGYSFGDRFNLDGWISWRATETISLSTGLSYMWEGELDGLQSDVSTAAPGGRRTVPTAFSDNYGGHRIEALAGVNYVIPRGFLKNHRLATDIRVPLWQEKNGVSLGVDYVVTVGWQYAF